MMGLIGVGIRIIEIQRYSFFRMYVCDERRFVLRWDEDEYGLIFLVLVFVTRFEVKF